MSDDQAFWYVGRYKGKILERKGFCVKHITERWKAGVSQHYERCPEAEAPKEPAVCVDCQVKKEPK